MKSPLPLRARPVHAARRRGVGLVVLAALLPVAASAEDARAPLSAEAAGELAKKPRQGADQGPVVTYSGLRVYEDGSAVFRVELTQKAAVKQSATGKQVHFLIEGARITVKNNKNPLLAQHFQSNVVSARLVSADNGVTVVIELREPAKLGARLVEQAGGAVTLRVDVPALQPK